MARLPWLTMTLVLVLAACGTSPSLGPADVSFGADAEELPDGSVQLDSSVPPDASEPAPDASQAVPDAGAATFDVSIDGLPGRSPLSGAIALTAVPSAGAPTGLSYLWSCTCGALSKSDGSTTTWTAPGTASWCDVTVVASAGAVQASGVSKTRATNATKLVATDARGDGTGAGFDIGDYYYGVVNGSLFVEVGLPTNTFKSSQVEVFLLQTAADQWIHSFGVKAGVVMFWQADRPSGHPHYHWQEAPAPASLHIDISRPNILAADIALADVGLDAQAQMRTGVAGAPTTVAQTASYTDRLPDALLVTPTDVEGLQTVSLP